MNNNQGIIQAFQAINQLSNRLNDLTKIIEQYINTAHNDSVANIDYLALMTDVELPSNKDIEEEKQGEEV